ncbi:pectate lyase family protein [Treponema ruminis]|uniref:Pectate lyase n=1 Tax=Treponema ruminis TaxID=744515 RepID=A0A7W8LKQ9_9SPIR|nr:hypothetical protein [Treponema ruminis]MBB5224688.1 pectate lyase [Treponema ruminis]
MFKTSKEIKKIVVLAFAAALIFSGCSVESKGSDSEPESVSDTDDSKTGEEDSEKNEAEKSIKLGDLPVGYASVSVQGGEGTTVTSRAELLSAVSKGGLIYVKGTIDMSDGCLPGEAGGSTAALDKFVAEKSKGKFADYAEFKEKYAASCSSSTDDKTSSNPQSSLGSEMWNLNKKYGDVIKIKIKSNTTIIGLENAVIKGGTIQISGVSNVILRNLTIQDGYDPFPHHEKNDGFNAQWDNVAILDSSENIWIDHCTFEDTMKYSMVDTSSGSEKWQTYDGLCDITKSAKNVVVSYCVFKNHDKTMLIGSSSSDLSGGNITIHHNRFLNCGQRLPMTCYPNMHIFNNSYERDSNAYYSQQASIAARYGAYTIIAENNYFGSGVKKCITASTNASGKCYESGNKYVSGSCSLETQDEKPFAISYAYNLDDASKIKNIVYETAGAGCTLAED